MTTTAQAQPVVQDAWQPIETAPKDGSTILLGKSASIDDDRATSTAGFWQKGWEDSLDDVGCDDGFVDVRFQEFSPRQSSGAQQYRSSQPTHWQPLPAPPTPQESTK